MAKKTLNTGTTANDGHGDTLRDAAGKINDNFTELYGTAFPDGGNAGYLTPEEINTLLELNAILATGGSEKLVDSAEIQARIDASVAGGVSFTDLTGLNENLSDATLVDSDVIQTRIDAAITGGAGSGLPEFFRGIIGDKVLIVQTGQSNPQGLEIRSASVSVDTWENANVFDWQHVNRSGTAIDEATRNLPGNGDWGWVSPATTQPYPTNTPGGLDLSYFGYMGANTGNQAYALANEIQISTGMDVYVVNLSQGAAPQNQWETTGGGSDHAETLRIVVQYILAGSSGVDFGDKPGPDITTWGQSESSYPAPLGNDPLTPAAWSTALAAIFDKAKGQTKSWISDGYTKIFLTEGTEYLNWNGTAFGTAAYSGVPYRWIGSNMASELYGDDCTLVSSRGIEHGDDTTGTGVTAPAATAATFFVHFTGDGNDAYGRRIADVILGREREFKDTDADIVKGDLEVADEALDTRVTVLETAVGTSLPSIIQRNYGLNGLAPTSLTHFASVAPSGVYNTDGGLVGNEPVWSWFIGSGDITESYNISHPGNVILRTTGAAAYTGAELTIYPLRGDFVESFTIGANTAPKTERIPNGDLLYGTQRDNYRFGFHQPMRQSNRNWGMWFETRYDSDNWWFVVKDSATLNIAVDSGIPYEVYVGVLGSEDTLQMKYDASAGTCKFFINGNEEHEADVSTFDSLQNVASVGAYIIKTEGNGDVEVALDLMYVEAVMSTDTFAVGDFI